MRTKVAAAVKKAFNLIGLEVHRKPERGACGPPPQLAVRLDRQTLAEIYLSGEGIEIGALHNPLPVPAAAKVRYVDRAPIEKLRSLYPDLEGIVTPDIVDDGETLAKVADASQDFVIANHFIEHCEDPIKTIENLLRVLKRGGVLYLTVPDKRFTFDVDRPVTTLEHVLRDYREGPQWSRAQHFEEYHRVVLQVSEEGEAQAIAARLAADADANTHFHVWSQAEMFTFVSALKTVVGLDLEVEAYCANGIEGIFILRKGEAGRDRKSAELSLADARAQDRQRSSARECGGA